MDDYLRTVKTITNSLVAIYSPISNLGLIQYTTTGLQHSPKYEGFLITYSMLLGAHSFDDLSSKLIFFEQRMKFNKERDVPSHQALATTIGSVVSDSGGAGTNKQANSTSKGKNNGGHNFNKGVRDVPTKTTTRTTIARLSTTLQLP